MNPLISFDKERLLLCEGSMDKTFFEELIAARGLPEFQVQFPLGALDSTGGISKFGHFLKGNINEQFLKIVRGVLVVADNDDNPAGNFALVRQQIRDAGYGEPMRELEFVPSPQPLPPIAIMMLPLNGQKGNLESVIKPAAFEKWPDLEQPVNAYCAASPANDWSVGKQDKMKLQSIIAATCEANPYCTVSTLYRENAQYHIPLGSPLFADVAQVLSDFDTLLAAI